MWLRIRYRCQGNFLVGVAVGLIIVVAEVVKQKPIAPFRSVALVLGLGMFFGLLYGLVSLLPVHILVRHDHIGRQHGQSYTRLEYKILRDYHIESNDVDGTELELLTLEGEGGNTFTFELSQEVDKGRLEKTLNRYIRQRRVSA